MRKVIQRQRTFVGRLQREVGRKMSALGLAVQAALGHTLSQAQRLIAQTASRKNPGKQGKLYSWHAPEVECISKGKSRTPYEFGVKVGIATTLQGNLIVGARTFPGNPYDGHTLNEQLEQASILMQATGMQPETVYVDLGYRGVDQANPGIDIKHRGKFKSLTEQEKKMLKRRQAIEPIIGHLKADHRMNLCHLKGANGDSLHAVLCAAGYFHSLVAADDRQKRAGPFFAAVAGSGFDRLHRFAAQITRNLERKTDHLRFRELGGRLKVDFSGTTI
jgi:IS5 family transposase